MSSNNSAKREARRIAKETRDYIEEQERGRRRDHREAANDQPKPEFRTQNTKPIEALNERQEQHKEALFSGDSLVIAIGYAGTGKTWLNTAVAAQLYLQKQVKQLILTRPNVETGPGFGFLPGTLDEKYAPFLEPFKYTLIDRLGSNKFECDIKRNIIPSPLQFMRGRTFDDCVILLDEAQNVTVAEMKMIITRPGVNAYLFISGDTKQCDLKLRPGEENGLDWLVRRLAETNSLYNIIKYTKEDNVRSGFSREMLDLIEEE